MSRLVHACHWLLRTACDPKSHLASPTPYTHTRTAMGTFRPWKFMACEGKNCLHKMDFLWLTAVTVNSPGGHEGLVGMYTAHQPFRFLKLVSLAVSLWWMSSALIFGGRKRDSAHSFVKTLVYSLSVPKRIYSKTSVAETRTNSICGLETQVQNAQMMILSHTQ